MANKNIGLWGATTLSAKAAEYMKEQSLMSAGSGQDC